MGIFASSSYKSQAEIVSDQAEIYEGLERRAVANGDDQAASRWGEKSRYYRDHLAYLKNREETQINLQHAIAKTALSRRG